MSFPLDSAGAFRHGTGNWSSRLLENLGFAFTPFGGPYHPAPIACSAAEAARQTCSGAEHPWPTARYLSSLAASRPGLTLHSSRRYNSPDVSTKEASATYIPEFAPARMVQTHYAAAIRVPLGGVAAWLSTGNPGMPPRRRRGPLETPARSLPLPSYSEGATGPVSSVPGSCSRS